MCTRVVTALSTTLVLGGCYSVETLRHQYPDAVRTYAGEPQAIAECMVATVGKQWHGINSTRLELGEIRDGGRSVEVLNLVGGVLGGSDPWASWTFRRRDERTVTVEFRRRTGLIANPLDEDDVFVVVEKCAGPALVEP